MVGLGVNRFRARPFPQGHVAQPVTEAQSLINIYSTDYLNTALQPAINRTTHTLKSLHLSLEKGGFGEELWADALVWHTTITNDILMDILRIILGPTNVIGR